MLFCICSDLCFCIFIVLCKSSLNYWNEYFIIIFLFFLSFILVLEELAYWKDSSLRKDVKIELLEENLSFVRHAIGKLDKKYRKFMARHSDCFPRKIIFLHR
jgi:hypothetical protein